MIDCDKRDGAVSGSAEGPAEALSSMAGGFAMTQVLHVAAQIGVADFIGEQRVTAGEIAAGLGMDPQALERFLRMMVVLDLLVQVEHDTFMLSAAGNLLRRNHPQSMRDRILYIGAVNYPVAGAALHSVRTGKPAFDHVFGVPYFDYLATNPDLGRAFNGLMQRAVEARIDGVLRAGDFSRVRDIVDIGGGNGALLTAILLGSEKSTGVIFDQPAVVAEGRRRFRESELEPRLGFIEGDLFEGAYPTGADLYILSNILHDWDDARAARILEHCVRAMRRDSELLLIEETLPDRVEESPSTIANDYSMLLLTGGRERSEAQYRALLNRSGLSLVRTVPFTLQNSDARRRGRWSLIYCRAT